MFERLLVTGEGPTDMGCCKNRSEVCTGEDYQTGPVGILMSKFLERYLPEWNVDLLNLHNPESFTTFIYRAWFDPLTKAKKPGKIRPGKNRVEKGYVEHADRALALGNYAKKYGFQLAAYFHDTDGTISQRRDDSQRWEHLVAAIKQGFRAAEYLEYGIAVVPEPKSEAWFLCACKTIPYQDCNKLEKELSGNDRSPKNAPKKVLVEALGVQELDRDKLCDIAWQVEIDKIDMNSFNAVRVSFRQAIEKICGQVRD